MPQLEYIMQSSALSNASSIMHFTEQVALTYSWNISAMF